MRILIVCQANRVRSIMVQAVFNAKLEQQGLTNHIEVVSAGIDADPNSAIDHQLYASSSALGYCVKHQATRLDQLTDLSFDWILVCDHALKKDVSNFFEKTHRLSPSIAHLLEIQSPIQRSELPDPSKGNYDYEMAFLLYDTAVDAWLNQLIKEII